MISPKLAPVPARQERQFGEVSEWLKEHAWKVCIRQRIGGSNPPSPPYLKKSSYESTGFFFAYCTHRGDEKPRPGFDNWRQPVGQNRERSERAARRASEASQSPPSPPYLKKSSYESTGFFFVYCTHRGDEKPRPGFDNWRQPVGQTVNAVSGLPAGRAKRVNPPPHRHL